MDTGLTDRILDEALRMISESGFVGLRIEQLAANIGCGKAAVYRRFATPGELAASALVRHLVVGEDKDSGDAIDDLMTLNQEHVDRTYTPDSPTAGSGVVSAMFDPEVRDHMWARHYSLRRARGRAIIARGKERGQIRADIDPDIVLDALAGFTLYRSSVRGAALTREDTRRLVEVLTGASPSAPVALPSENSSL